MVEKSKSQIDGIKFYPGEKEIQYAYNNTNESATIRRLLVDMYLFAAADTWLQQWKEQDNNPHRFLFDLALELLGQQNRRRPGFTTSSYYVVDSKDVKSSSGKRGS